MLQYFLFSMNKNMFCPIEGSIVHCNGIERQPEGETGPLISPGSINNGRQCSFLSVSANNLRSEMAGRQSYCVIIKTVQSSSDPFWSHRPEVMSLQMLLFYTLISVLFYMDLYRTFSLLPKYSDLAI